MGQNPKKKNSQNFEWTRFHGNAPHKMHDTLEVCKLAIFEYHCKITTITFNDTLLNVKKMQYHQVVSRKSVTGQVVQQMEKTLEEKQSDFIYVVFAVEIHAVENEVAV